MISKENLQAEINSFSLPWKDNWNGYCDGRKGFRKLADFGIAKLLNRKQLELLASAIKILRDTYFVAVQV